MGSNQEIQRIHKWIADLYGVTEEYCPFSREDIRNICRGPMREVLMDFLLPRFRTDDQIKVIRSNLFLHEVGFEKTSDQDNVGTAQHERRIRELKEELNRVHEEKVKVIQLISKKVMDIGESKQDLKTKWLDFVTNFEKSESRAELLRDRVASTSILVQEMGNTKASITSAIPTSCGSPSPATFDENNVGGPGVGLLTDSVELSPSFCNNNSGQIMNPHLAQIKALQNNASELFELHWLQSCSPRCGGNGMFTADFEALKAKVAKQTEELTASGISPSTLEKWIKSEQDLANAQLRNLSAKYSNAMSPLEELQHSTEALYMKLLNVHVGLHIRNQQLKQKIAELYSENQQRLQEAILDPNTIPCPSDLMLRQKMEEDAAMLAKCRELSKHLKKAAALIEKNEEEDLLDLLCSASGASVSNGIGLVNGDAVLPQCVLRASLGSGDGNGSFSTTNQEALEDLTCALLKSFPHSRTQLEASIQQSKSLVLEKFPKVLQKDSKNNDNMLKKINMPPATDREVSCASLLNTNRSIPELFNPIQELANSPLCTEEGDQLLSEVFRMQNELESKKLQTEQLLKERESIKVPSSSGGVGSDSCG